MEPQYTNVTPYVSSSDGALPPIASLPRLWSLTGAPRPRARYRRGAITSTGAGVRSVWLGSPAKGRKMA